MVSEVRVITNIDGIEWRRDKWKGLARLFLRFSEIIAVRFSHEIIVDNEGIAAHVFDTYGKRCHVIPYGGDHAVRVIPSQYFNKALPKQYALTICRIEPENNVTMILEAFAKQVSMPLIFVGNWSNSKFGRKLRDRFVGIDSLYLLDPIYDLGILHTLRSNAKVYIHGHSAGGTNPSLVEAMHFGIPVLAYDCVFNRHTTENNALWFGDAESLLAKISSLKSEVLRQVGTEMKRIAECRYTWERVGQDYFRLLLKND
jgi:glycosyltransferase involved in cell wall biosynthesis